MKSTGIVRKIDDLGRVVIPIELRRSLNVDVKDSLEIFVDGDRIILRKYTPGCVFCGSLTEVSHVRGKLLCRSCVSEIAESRGVLA